MASSPDLQASEKPLLLIVDDDPLIADTLSFSMGQAFEVLTSHSRPHCTQLLRQLRKRPDLALVDLGLPPLPHRPDEGFALIVDLLKTAPEMKIVVLSGQSDESNARHARTLGACDFVPKPCNPADLQAVLQRALRFRALDDAQTRARKPSPLIGDSPPMQKLRAQLQQYADAPFPVLIEGESGSGKEIVASRCLHFDTPRGDKPFFALNCAAIAPTLVEPTLFGYARGAFTGATTAKAGYFEDAGDGTLFLDEIGELPLAMQTKLLRVLEERKVRPVGSEKEVPVDVRIVAASNRDLAGEVAAGRFRQDLYFRLAVVDIAIPPLRTRREDIAELAAHFMALLSAQLGVAPLPLARETLDGLANYPWPGNVRELRNFVERSLILGGFPVELLPSAAVPPTDAAAGDEASTLDLPLAEVEKRHILRVLDAAGGNKSEAARRLGVSRKTLERKCAEWLELDLQGLS